MQQVCPADLRERANSLAGSGRPLLPRHCSRLLNMLPEHCRKSAGNLVVLAGNVMLLKRIMLEVVELEPLERIVLKQLPGPLTDSIIILALIPLPAFSPHPDERSIERLLVAPECWQN